MNKDNIQSEIEYFESELRNLKVPQGVVRDVESFYYEHLNPAQKLLIRYGQSDNVPITIVRAVGGFAPKSAITRYDRSNRTQYVYFSSDWVLPDSVLIFSTAPIQSVENVS